MQWVLQSDVLIAEITTPSLGVGYEIGRAIENGKKVLCLYRLQDGKKISAMINGCSNVEKAEYKMLDEAKQIIDNFFQKLF